MKTQCDICQSVHRCELRKAAAIENPCFVDSHRRQVYPYVKKSGGPAVEVTCRNFAHLRSMRVYR